MPCCFSSDKPAAGRTPRAVSKNLYAGFPGMQSVRQSWTVFFCFLFFGSMDTKMSTMSPFGGEAGSGEFSGGLQFEDAVPVLLEGVSALLPGFPITMHSTLVNKLLQTVQVFFTILLSG